MLARPVMLLNEKAQQLLLRLRPNGYKAARYQGREIERRCNKFANAGRPPCFVHDPYAIISRKRVSDRLLLIVRERLDVDARSGSWNVERLLARSSDDTDVRAIPTQLGELKAKFLSRGNVEFVPAIKQKVFTQGPFRTSMSLSAKKRDHRHWRERLNSFVSSV